MGYPLSFIHIGLPKCASTYLQSVWLRDPNYNALDLGGVVQLVRQFSADEIDGGGQFPAITGEVPTLDGHTNMASHEGFSWGYTNNPAKQHYIGRLHGVSAQMLGEAGLTDSILIMVRNPANWLRAMHEQTIKEGGSSDFATFREQQQQLILGPMNLAQMQREYGRFFDRVVFLSADQLRHQPDAFWSQYAEAFSVPVPAPEVLESAKDSFAANRSLGGAVYELAMMNRYSGTLFNTFSGLQGYPEIFAQEYQGLRDVLDGRWLWHNRRIAEFATAEQLAALASQLNLDESGREAFLKVEIDASMAETIERIYLQPLEAGGTLSPELLAQYRTDLAAIVAD